MSEKKARPALRQGGPTIDDNVNPRAGVGSAPCNSMTVSVIRAAQGIDLARRHKCTDRLDHARRRDV